MRERDKQQQLEIGGKMKSEAEWRVYRVEILAGKRGSTINCRQTLRVFIITLYIIALSSPWIPENYSFVLAIIYQFSIN